MWTGLYCIGLISAKTIICALEFCQKWMWQCVDGEKWPARKLKSAAIILSSLRIGKQWRDFFIPIYAMQLCWSPCCGARNGDVGNSLKLRSRGDEWRCILPKLVGTGWGTGPFPEKNNFTPKWRAAVHCNLWLYSICICVLCCHNYGVINYTSWFIKTPSQCLLAKVNKSQPIIKILLSADL